MRFSIIVPTFNSQETLEKCLEAIVNLENFANCQLIVADDGSTDSSVEIAKRYGAKVVSNQTNQGAASIRNLGAKLAKGDILLFIDSDVVLSKNALKHIEEDFNSLDICGVDGVYDEKVVFENFSSAYKHCFACFGQPISQMLNPVASSAILAVPRKKFLESGGFNEEYLGVMAEDIEFSIRFALKENKFFLIDPRIKGIHLKKYNFKTLLKTDYLRIKGMSKALAKKEYRDMYWRSYGVSLFLVFLQPKFFNYLKKHRDFRFALLAIGFSFIEMFFVAICGLYFQLFFRLKQ